MAEVDGINIDQMYSPGNADVVDRALNRSYDPRPADLMFTVLDDLEVGPDDVVLDIGGRDASNSLVLVQMFGCRAVSVDPVDSNNEMARAAVTRHPAGS